MHDFKADLQILKLTNKLNNFLMPYIIQVSNIFTLISLTVMYVKLPEDHSLMNVSDTSLGLNHVHSSVELDTDSMTDVVSVSTENSEASCLSSSLAALSNTPISLSSVAKNRPKRKASRNNALRHYKKRKKKAKIKQRLRVKSMKPSLGYRDRGMAIHWQKVANLTNFENCKMINYWRRFCCPPGGGGHGNAGHLCVCASVRHKVC